MYTHGITLASAIGAAGMGISGFNAASLGIGLTAVVGAAIAITRLRPRAVKAAHTAAHARDSR